MFTQIYEFLEKTSIIYSQPFYLIVGRILKEIYKQIKIDFLVIYLIFINSFIYL